MKDTEEESAVLKQRLKHEPLSAELEAEAAEHTQEAEESVWEVEQGLDTCSPGSYVERERAAPEHVHQHYTTGGAWRCDCGHTLPRIIGPGV